MMTCPKCGAELPFGATECPACREPISVQNVQQPVYAGAPAPEIPQAPQPAAQPQAGYYAPPPPNGYAQPSGYAQPGQAPNPGYYAQPGQPVQQTITVQSPYAVPVKEDQGIGGWIGTFILESIPIVNLIMYIVWACGGTRKPSLRKYGIARLIFWPIVIIVFAIIIAAMGGFSEIMYRMLYY